MLSHKVEYLKYMTNEFARTGALWDCISAGSTGMPTEGRKTLTAGRPHVALIALISRICHPMSLEIGHLSSHYAQQYIHLTRLIEYYCCMGILKICSRLAKAVHCIHPVELFIRGLLHLSLNGISY